MPGRVEQSSCTGRATDDREGIMVEWEYLWRRTYWTEVERSGDYVQWITYDHAWKPDRENELPFPGDEGLDRLGKAGWELVTMTPSTVSLMTQTSKQGDGYSNFTVYLLMFKRPVA
jgi:hypothetical protein